MSDCKNTRKMSFVFRLIVVCDSNKCILLILVHCSDCFAGSILQVSDPEVQCWVGDHVQYMAMGVLAVLLYALGIPMIILGILLKHRGRLHEGRVRSRFGAAFRLYKYVPPLRLMCH